MIRVLGLRVLLAVALLIACQGALLHPLKHVNAEGGYVHFADGHEQQDPANEKSARDPVCDVVAAVALCIGNAPALSIVPASRRGFVRDFSSSAARNALALAYRSQAPPKLL